MKGKINCYNDKKGFGFIHSDSGEDLFFHCTSLQNLSFVLAGATVEFEEESSEKGPKATNIFINSLQDSTPVGRRQPRTKHDEGNVPE